MKKTIQNSISSITVAAFLSILTFSNIPLAFAAAVDPHVTSGVAIPLPIEILAGNPYASGYQEPTVSLANGKNLNYTGAAYEVQLTLSSSEASSAADLVLNTHNITYDDMAIVVINGVEVDITNCATILNSKLKGCQPPSNPLIRLDPATTIWGGIGGPIITNTLTIPISSGMLKSGVNTFWFAFNMKKTESLASGYRILGLNLQMSNGTQLLSSSAFTQFNPANLTAPTITSVNEAAEEAMGCSFSGGLTQKNIINCGQHLFFTASLNPNINNPGLPNMQARCFMCHVNKGQDLAFFNVSNTALIERSKFHGLTAEQGNLIAAYIASLRNVNTDLGREWASPFQPGPGVDANINTWVAGSGSALTHDRQMLTSIFPSGTPSESAIDPKGDLPLRDISVALPLPGYFLWLPRMHPLDAFGSQLGVNLKSVDNNGNITLNVTTLPANNQGWTGQNQANAQQRLINIINEAQSISTNLSTMSESAYATSLAKKSSFIMDNANFSGDVKGLEDDYSLNGGYTAFAENFQQNTNLNSLMLWANLQNLGFMITDPNLINDGQAIFGSTASSYGVSVEPKTFYNTSFWQSSAVISRLNRKVPVEASPAANPPTADDLAGDGDKESVFSVYLDNAWFWVAYITNNGNNIGSNVINFSYMENNQKKAMTLGAVEPVRDLARYAATNQHDNFVYGEGDKQTGLLPYQTAPYLFGAPSTSLLLANDVLADDSDKGYVMALGSPTPIYFNGTVNDADFAGLGINLDTLFWDLYNNGNGYIDLDGNIQPSFITLLESGSTTMSLNAADKGQNLNIFNIMKAQTFYQPGANPNSLIVGMQQAWLDAFNVRLSQFSAIDFQAHTGTYEGQTVKFAGDPAYSSTFLPAYQVNSSACVDTGLPSKGLGYYNDPENLFNMISGAGGGQGFFTGYNTSKFVATAESLFDSSTPSLANEQKAEWNQFSASNTSNLNPCANILPVIAKQPMGGSVKVGKSFTFSVMVNAAGNVSYNWFQVTTQGKTVSLGSGNGASYTISSASSSSAGSYYVNISNNGGGVNSNSATLTVTN